jgi:hypothetical protein
MKKMKTSMLLISVVVIAVLGSTGCFAVRQFNVKEGYEGYQNLHPELAAVEKKNGNDAIVVDLVVPKTSGCVPLRLKDGGEKESYGDFRCKVSALTTGQEKVDLKQKYKSMDRNEGAPQKMGFAMIQYGAALQRAVENQFAGHFGNVTVNRVDDPPGNATSVALDGTLYFKFWRTDRKTVKLILTATPENGGAPISVTEEVSAEMGNGHLAWMIPVGVLTFPVGFAIGSAVFNNMETDFIERIIGQAMDQAAKSLASKLAGQVASTGNNRYRVYLSVAHL